MKNSALGIPL